MKDLIMIDASNLRNWLFNHCLPLWLDYGIDNEVGGFYERVNQDLSPDNVNRRTRVAARQVYSFALATKMGFERDTSKAINHGLKWLETCQIRNQHYLSAVLDNQGNHIDSAFNLYDHAFAMLAYASAYSMGMEAYKDIAQDILINIKSEFSHPVAGFHSSNPPSIPLKTNPHMHMFETALAWIDLGVTKNWLELAQIIADLCLDKFIDAENGSLREYFDLEWRPTKDDEGRIIEPGHQYEWAWLLMRFAKISDNSKYIVHAKKLVEIADEFGVCKRRGVCINELWSDFSIKDENARLWPQTERIKAHKILYDCESEIDKKRYHSNQVKLAVAGLEKYFTTEIKGLYFDKMLPNGNLVEESSPTSTLYHIICAINEVGKK